MTAAPVRALTAGALTAALAIGFPAAAAAADPSEPTMSTSEGKTKLEFTSTIVDGSYTPKGGAATDSIPESGPKAGDSFTFTDELRQGTTTVGTATGTCLFEEAAVAACETTLKFPSGTIVTVGKGDSTKAPVEYRLSSGTGKYAAISGTGTVTQLSEKEFTNVLEFQLGSTDGQASGSTDGQVSATPSGGAETGGGAGVASESLALLALGGAAAVAGSALFVRGRRTARG